MIYNIYKVLFLGFLLILFSCEIYNPKEDIPSYIKIDTIVLSTTGDEGTSSHKITDVWIYMDDNPIGAFELPAKFPVLAEGNHKITIRPGIKLNGISSTRSYYPFYEEIVYPAANLEKGKTFDLSVLNTTYYSVSKFLWNEDYESSGITIEKTSKSDTAIQKVTDNVFEGNYSGAVYLDSGHDFFELTSSETFDLPFSNSPVFLELNFKTNNTVTVGVYLNTTTYTIQRDYVVLNPTDTWQKIYINLTPVVIYSGVSVESFKVFLSGYKDEGVSEAVILLDNIKLLSF